MPDILSKYRIQVILILVGILLISGGLFLARVNMFSSPKVEVLNTQADSNQEKDTSKIVIEVSGSVRKPGVYELPLNSRIDDALQLAEGVSSDADLEWISKYLNKASYLQDGQKIYIPSQSEDMSDNVYGGGEGTLGVSQTQSNELVNINTATQSELESLWGIGPVTAQKIIEQRMYTSVEQLSQKGILKSNVYEANKDKMTVY